MVDKQYLLNSKQMAEVVSMSRGQIKRRHR